MQGRLIAIDVGAGTADIVIRQPGEPAENSVKLVVPSQTQVVGARIRAATRAGAAVLFHGPTMGGGADTRAMKEHTAAGLAFLATPSAARSFADDLERARARGVEVIGEEEAEAARRRGTLTTAGGGRLEIVAVRSGDVDAAALREALTALGVATAFDGGAIAVQDHGFTPGGSNRAYRFSLWERAVRERRALPDLFYRADRDEIPERLTRMQSAAGCLRELLPDPLPLLAGDTGPAALLGALSDTRTRAAGAAHEGAGAAHESTRPAHAATGPVHGPTVLVNIGNGHTIAAVERDGCLAAVYEHHTRRLDGPRLVEQLRRFLAGELTNDEVRNDGGHGSVLHEPLPADVPLLVTGPNRRLLDGTGLRVRHPAPWGDMMIAGSVGLIEAFTLKAD